MDKIYVQSNVELNISIAKNVFLIIFIYYTNFKITNKKIELNCKFIIDNFIIIIFGIICAMIKNKISFAISIISSILIISLIFSKDMTTKSIITTIISYAINYTIFCITIIVSFIFNMITKLNNDYMNFVVILITHILVLYHFCKIKRFKNGFLFLKNKNNNEYIDILILNIGIMILYIIATIIHYDIVIGRELITIVTTVIPIMFVTIKKSLQLYYKQKLLIQDLNETKEELEKTKSDLKQVEEENLGLSKKSHSIAHKQKALEYKMQQLLTNAEISKEEAGEVQDRVKEIQKDLYKDKAITQLSKTEIPKIDDMLEYMQSECIKNKIEFELQISGNIHYMVKGRFRNIASRSYKRCYYCDKSYR